MSPDETLLESSERNGGLIPSGCRRGRCGTCATKLLSGNVRMEREEALNDELRRHASSPHRPAFVAACRGPGTPYLELLSAELLTLYLGPSTETEFDRPLDVLARLARFRIT